MAWLCSVCGDEHAEALRDIRTTLPEPVFRLAEPERSERAELGEDWCVLLERSGRRRSFVRALLHVPVRDEGDDFRFGVWAEVEPRDFERIGELWHDEAGSETPPFFGSLANELAPYAETEGLPLALQLRDVRLLPAVVVLDAAHPLGRDQRGGIDVAQANALAETVLH